MLLLIDNYDSFTYNLYQYLSELGAEMHGEAQRPVTLAEIEAMQPDHIVISPGPCTPDEAGMSCAIIGTFGPHIPTLGVCLGHQAIGQVYGGHVVRAPGADARQNSDDLPPGTGCTSTTCPDHSKPTATTASSSSAPLSRLNWRSPRKQRTD